MLKRFLGFLLFVLFAWTCTKEEKPIVGRSNKVVVSTSASTVVTATSITINSTLSADGIATILEKGYCWNTTQAPTVNDNSLKLAANAPFTGTITGLLPGTNYSIRAYIKSTTDIIYGNEIRLKTLSAPSLTTTAITAITNISATGGGNITSDGGSAITARGVCWNTVASPTIANNRTLDGAGVGVFTSSLTGLTPGTTYFVRSYATNSAGTAYGPQVTFTTSASLPTISSTTGVSSITTTGGVSGGNITSDGGSAVTARGVCWNTVGSPTIANTRTLSGTGLGIFTASMTGLAPGTTYYVRAYATNAAGTAYGPQVTFTTSSVVAETCAITGVTNGTTYSMQAPVTGSIFVAGNPYKITMASAIFAFGQASEVALFRNEVKVFTYGTFLLFNEAPGNARTFSIPSGMTPSTCYTIRVTKPEGLITAVYVSPRFEIR